MRYLLDVNALIAFGVPRHQFHQRVVDWIKSQRGSAFLTTSITEIGFVRVVASVPHYDLTVLQAKSLLLGMKANASQPLNFLADGNDIASIPEWAGAPGQVTDGHLLRLAADHGALFATLDQRIPGSFLIPKPAHEGL
jgi:predicted nucleic acid-binding protein